MQRDLGNALKGKDSLLAMLLEKKKDLLEWVNSLIQLCLADDVMREVVEKNTSTRFWLRLKGWYMAKGLTNCMYIDKGIFGEEIETLK